MAGQGSERNVAGCIQVVSRTGIVDKTGTEEIGNRREFLIDFVFVDKGHVGESIPACDVQDSQVGDIACAAAVKRRIIPKTGPADGNVSAAEDQRTAGAHVQAIAERAAAGT